MKRFSFRLQQVMELRNQQERMRQQELAAAVRGEEAQHGQVARLREDRERCEGTVVASSRSRKGLSKILLYRAYHDRLSREIGEETLRLQKLEEETERRRETLIGASRERKTMETLRDRASAEHQQSERREDQAFMDETAARVHLRSKLL